MPSTAEILDGLGRIASSWSVLAILWHVYFAVFAASALLGRCPPNRLAGALLILPIASVSILAWTEGNPFNGTVFALLSLGLIILLRGLSTSSVEMAAPVWIVLGSLLFAFGWAYPHFLEAEPLLTYLYAAPLGLVPCPTLAMVVGVSLIFRGLSSRAWSLVLASASLFYGAFGSLYLGVGIDWALTGGAMCLFVLSMQQTGGGSGWKN